MRRTTTALTVALAMTIAQATPLAAQGTPSTTLPAAGPNPAPSPGATPTERSAGAITGGLPAMRGVTPSRAELPDSAFIKLDAAQRGYLTREDTLPLTGFDEAFRLGDRNGDGRLDAREFHDAWTRYSTSTR